MRANIPTICYAYTTRACSSIMSICGDYNGERAAEQIRLSHGHCAGDTPVKPISGHESLMARSMLCLLYRAVTLAELAPEQRPPEGICRLHAKFWACAVCGKAYWKVCTSIKIFYGAMSTRTSARMPAQQASEHST